MTIVVQSERRGKRNFVWKALAHPLRRRILDAMRTGPKTTGYLAMMFPKLSRFAVMQHLKVLVRAKLVIPKKSGRLRLNYINVVPIREIYERWVSQYSELWSGMLTDLKSRSEQPL